MSVSHASIRLTTTKGKKMHNDTDIECLHCGFHLAEWELDYSKIYCTVCPGLGYPEFIPFASWED